MDRGCSSGRGPRRRYRGSIPLRPRAGSRPKRRARARRFCQFDWRPVFDGTLRQGLAVQLEQSPFLSLIPEQRIQHTLRLMGWLPDAPLTPELARNVCERTGGAAVLEGSIAKLGSQYVLGLRARSCRTGDILDD